MGLNPNIVRAGNTTLLTACVEKGEVVSVRLIVEHGANVDVQDSYGKTALMAAVSKKNIDVARILLEYKANPNLGNPLQVAATGKNMPLCQLLIEKKAVLTQTTRDKTLAETGDVGWVDQLWKVYSNSSNYMDAFFTP